MVNNEMVRTIVDENRASTRKVSPDKNSDWNCSVKSMKKASTTNVKYCDLDCRM
jgi:hypothetical protein